MFPRRGALFAALAPLVLISLLLIAGCAPIPPREAPPVRLAEPRAAYQISGRLSARHGTDAFAATFHWTHDTRRDQLDLSSPLGQILARLSGDSHGVELRTPDGRVQSASDWTTLTSRGLGWALPVEGLASWIQGTPRKDAPFTAEAGGDGDLSVMRQDGWTITYQSFAPDGAGVRRPARMSLEYPDVELRLVIDAWQ